MSYNCQVRGCGRHVTAGKSRLMFTVYRDVPVTVERRVLVGSDTPQEELEGRKVVYYRGRPVFLIVSETTSRKEVARELAVCEICHYQLINGIPLKVLIRRLENQAKRKYSARAGKKIQEILDRRE